jgi:hypothetical protein
MIYLKNFTKYSDKALLKVLRYAERKLSLTGKTYVEVKTSKDWFHRFRGVAHPGWKVDLKKNREYDYGWIRISMPGARDLDELAVADDFLAICLHELAHIKDYRTNRHFKRLTTKAGKRIAHDKRPIEISAENQVYDARSFTRQTQLSREQKVLLDFAIEVERVIKGGK